MVANHWWTFQVVVFELSYLANVSTESHEIFALGKRCADIRFSFKETVDVFL